MENQTKSDKQRLDDFFNRLIEHLQWYQEMTSEVPKHLVVNPDIIGDLSRIEGFYQREELGGIVTVYSPLVRYFKLRDCVVMIVEDVDEKFLHFE